MPESQWKRRNYGESWSTGDTYNAAFGQGYVTVTPLQLITADAAIANGGTLYQPTLVENLQDANGNIVQDFKPVVDRTLVVPAGQEPVLLMQEDMLLQGPNSLACLCEKDSKYYDSAKCHPENYTAQADFDPNPSDDVHNIIRYRVNVPYHYAFDAGICDELEFKSISLNQDRDYKPPFVDASTLAWIQKGMREAVQVGTASKGALPYVNVAGKTGTAEYCDDVANAKGLCVPGQWPSHGWFVGYAPYENPEVIAVAFVYNGGEGSVVAAPIVHDVLDAYFKLKAERSRQPK